MFYPIKNRDDSENLEELASLQNQVEVLRLQGSLGKQNFHVDLKKLYEPLTDTIKDTSRNITRTLTGTSIKNNKVLEKLNDKFLEIVNDRGILASFLLSPLSKNTNLEQTRQLKLVKVPNSNRVKDLINKTTPVTLYINLLTFRDTDKKI